MKSNTTAQLFLKLITLHYTDYYQDGITIGERTLNRALFAFKVGNPFVVLKVKLYTIFL